MFKAAILLIGLIWASLLLISWGGSSTPQASTEQMVDISSRS